jgi:probable HAF family extracellular repeat protein
MKRAFPALLLALTGLAAAPLGRAGSYSITDLGSLDTANVSYQSSVAYGINNEGDVIGWSLKAEGYTVSTINSGFNGTAGVVLSPTGNIDVTSSVDGTVIEAVPNSSNTSIVASGLSSPGAMVYSATGVLLIANSGNGTVTLVATNGNTSTYVKGLSQPSGLVLDAQGDLYVSNSGNNTVEKITAKGNASIALNASKGLDQPTGIGLDSHGNLFVANFGSGAIIELSSTGVVSTFASDLGNLTGLTVDNHNDLFVADEASGDIIEITPAGTPSHYASGFSSPTSLAIDADSNLLVANGGNGTIAEIAPNFFNHAYIWTPANGMIDLGTLGGGNSLAYGVNDFGQVAGQADTNITTDPFLWSPDSGMVDLGTLGGPTDLGDAYDVANGVNNAGQVSGVSLIAGGNFFIADSSADVIYEATSQGNLSTYANATAGLSAPYGVIFDTSNNLYVSDSGGNVVTEITPDGNSTVFAANLSTPTGLAFDSSGDLFIANNGNNTVTEVLAGGLGTQIDTGANGLLNPTGLAFDSGGNLYVACSQDGGSVFIISPSGNSSLYATGFDNPAGLAFDGNDNLYVANNGNGTISEVSAGGNNTTTVTTFAIGFVNPVGLSFDGNGTLYVTDSATHAVSAVSATGNVTTYLSDLDSPTGIAFRSVGAQVAFLWSPTSPGATTGTMVSLGALGGNYSIAYGVNPSGQVIGEALLGNGAQHAFRWDPTTSNGSDGTMVDLGTLDGGSTSKAAAINASGQVTGYSYSGLDGDTVQHAVLWSPSGAIQDLGTLGGSLVEGDALNDAGQVVGDSQTGFYYLNGNPAEHAFLWTPQSGMQDLNVLTAGSGWTLEFAYGINIHGQITGYGFNPQGQIHAFLLTPEPTIVKGPASQVVKAGAKVTFTVSASGLGSFTYQWYKNGKAISGATSATLTLSKVTSANNGTYTVLARDSYGSVTSAAATLSVDKVPPSIVTQPKKATVKKGATATFKVVAKGDAPLSYQWQRNSANLKNGGNISGVTTATLKLTKVTAANAGNYRVIITNGAGKATSAVAKLTI